MVIYSNLLTYERLLTVFMHFGVFLGFCDLLWTGHQQYHHVWPGEEVLGQAVCGFRCKNRKFNFHDMPTSDSCLFLEFSLFFLIHIWDTACSQVSSALLQLLELHFVMPACLLCYLSYPPSDDSSLCPIAFSILLPVITSLFSFPVNICSVRKHLPRSQWK